MIDEILDFVKTHEYCDFQDISIHFELSKLEVEMLMDFLTKYDFVNLDKGRHQIRLSQEMLEFLKEVRCVDKEIPGSGLTQ